MSRRPLRLLLIASGLVGGSAWGCATSSSDPSGEHPEDDAGEASVVPSHTLEDASDARVDGDGDAGDGTCSSDGWCVVDYPWDGDVTLASVWGSSANDVWAVGSRGTILHWDGSSWQPCTSGLDQTFRRVWGSGPNDVWAFSTLRGILHSTGWVDGQASWSPVTFTTDDAYWLSDFEQETTPVVGVWGASATDIYVGTLDVPGGSVWHMTGWDDGKARWRPILQYIDYYGPVFGTSATDVWVAGWNGKVANSQGYKSGIVDWTILDSATRSNLRGLWGTTRDDVWVVGDTGTIRHWTYDDDGELRWLVSESNVTRHLNAVWGSRADDVWAVGEGNTILHGDGENWSRASLPPIVPAETRLFDVWGTSPDNVWIVGDSVILTRRRPSGSSQ